MEHRRAGRVHRLILQPPAQISLLETPRQQVELAISPGNRTTRYNRTWIIGQTELNGNVLSGRIGFQGDGTTDIWDDDRKDFVEIAIPAGTTAPFAINLETLQAAMQARGSLIKIQSLIGAFEALLLESGFKWKIVGLSRSVSLAEWKKSVTKVTSIRFTIRKPNPHYHGAKNLEDLMGEMETETIRLEAIAEAAGVNVQSEFIMETESHIERGYGEAEYRGVKGTGSEAYDSFYVTNVGTEEDSEEAEVDPETGEVPTPTLRKMLTQLPKKVENGEHADPDGIAKG